jgi:hypothetical protein
MPCIVILFSSHQRYCLRMLQLTHSLVKGAAANPKTLSYVRTTRSRRVTTPQALMTAAKATVRSDCGPNPNGAKLYTAGIRRRRFKRPRSES